MEENSAAVPGAFSLSLKSTDGGMYTPIVVDCVLSGTVELEVMDITLL